MNFMVSKRLAALLKIRPDEMRLVLLVAGLFAIVELGRGVGGSAADALFFLRFGVENLPWMYIVLGLTNFVTTLAYAAFLGRFSKGRFFTAILLILAVVLVIERAAILLQIRALYPVLWLSVNIVGALLGTMVWNTAGEVCDARQAKRLFPLFVSAGILGALIGSVVTGSAAALLGTENLIIIYAVLLVVCIFFVRVIALGYFRPAAKPDPSSSFLVDVRVGFDVVRRSPMLQLLAVSAVLFSILYFSVSFPFGRAVSASFSSEAEVAGFLGAFSGISSAITFVAALLIANRLYARIGVVNALLILPLTYLLGFLLFAVNFSLSTAVIVRLSQLVVLSGIGDGAYSAFFNVVPPNRRAQVRAFDSGVPSQIGIILSGVLLLLGEKLLTTTQIFVMGMVVALACAVVIWHMRRSYSGALLGALRAGRVEVFTQGERAFVGFRGDAEAIRLATMTLQDSKPERRRLAAEMLMRMDASTAAPAMVTQLADAEPSVRVAVLRALSTLIPNEPEGLLIQIAPLLDDPAATVRAQAATALARWGRLELALPTLTDLLQASDSTMRVIGINAIAEIFEGQSIGDTDVPAVSGFVVAALHDDLPAVRRAACQALSRIGGAAMPEKIVRCLSDADQTVRSAAALSLRQWGSVVTPNILAVLQARDIDHGATDAALAALTPSDSTARHVLRDLAKQEIVQLREWQRLGAAIPTSGRATRFLHDVLGANAVQSEQRLVKLLGLLHQPEAMEVVGRALTEHDADTRAAAVEALDMLGDKPLTRELVPLLEIPPVARDGVPETISHATDEAIDTLLHNTTGWPRILAIGAVGELALNRFVVELHDLAASADRLIGAATLYALNQLGEPMETLQTVSLIERIMLLREVPLFANLSPDDLKQIAEIAREGWYQDGDNICKEGDAGSELFIITTGAMRVVKNVDGTDKVLALRREGEFIGEMAIIDATVRFASVTAVGETRALVIDDTAFKAVMRDRPEVPLAVMRALSQRLREKI